MTNQEYEAEIARLKQGYEDLKEHCRFRMSDNDGSQWDVGWCSAHRRMLNQINKITGGNV